MPPEEAAVDVAIRDQQSAIIRDTVTEALRLVTYHRTLRDGGIGVGLTNRLVEEYQRFLLWPADEEDPE